MTDHKTSTSKPAEEKLREVIAYTIAVSYGLAIFALLFCVGFYMKPILTAANFVGLYHGISALIGLQIVVAFTVLIVYLGEEDPTAADRYSADPRLFRSQEVKKVWQSTIGCASMVFTGTLLVFPLILGAMVCLAVEALASLGFYIFQIEKKPEFGSVVFDHWVDVFFCLAQKMTYTPTSMST